MKKKPFFSIIMPVYNTEKYIRESIESVLEQDFTDWELIIVDDGSRDSAGKIADEYESNRIKIIHQKNSGVLVARQAAIKVANGKFIIFIDSDDYLLNGALNHIYKALSDNRKCDMLVFNFVRVSSRDKRFDIIESNERWIINDKAEIIKAILYDSSMNNLWRKAIKASCFDRSMDYSRYKHIVMGEDLLVTLDVLVNIDCLLLDESILYGYRVNRESVVSTDLEKPIIIDYFVREKAYCMLMEYIKPSSRDEEQYIKYCRKLFVMNTINKIAFQKCGFDVSKEIKNTPYYKKVLNRKDVYGAIGGKNTFMFEAFRRNHNFIIYIYGVLLRWKRKFR